jgi:hypothetical protein
MLGVSTQPEAIVPHYLTPFSYPLQTISILSGTKESVDVPLMKNMAEKRSVNKPPPIHKNEMARSRTQECFGELYPSFYAGPHAVSMSAAVASGYGFGREHNPVNAPHLAFKATHGHTKHMDAHHPHEEVKHVKSQSMYGESHAVVGRKHFKTRSMPHKERMLEKEHEKEGMFMKKAMAEHKKEGKLM